MFCKSLRDPPAKWIHVICLATATPRNRNRNPSQPLATDIISMAAMQPTSHDSALDMINKRLEELEKRYVDEKEVLMEQKNRLRAKQNRERGTVVLKDSCVKKMHNIRLKNTIVTKTEEIKRELWMINAFIHLMEYLEEDFNNDRKLVRLDEECGDGYEVYVFEYRRVFDWDGFMDAHPDFEDEFDGDTHSAHESDEGKPFLKKYLKPTDYKFLTRDGGLTFEMFEGVIDAKDVMSA